MKILDEFLTRFAQENIDSTSLVYKKYIYDEVSPTRSEYWTYEVQKKTIGIGQSFTEARRKIILLAKSKQENDKIDLQNAKLLR